jgi:1-acyl-sn-glycerol-3-phosphate acyltransferase
VVRTPFLDFFRPGMLWFSRAYFGLVLRGVEHVPLHGPLIIAPNHQTYADPPLVTIPVRRPVYYMAWDQLFRIPVFNRMITALRAFPVDIEARDSRAVRQVVRLLREGEAVMIFPEGERSLDGRVQDFKLGAFRVAVSQQVPVLPVTIAGGHEAWPPARRLPRPGRITITYHPVLRGRADLTAREAAHDLAERTRESILSGMEMSRRVRSSTR